MLKLFKEFKPFTISIIIIIGLLLFQASTELALPDYLSNIVNVGIQQNGIKDVVPEVIRASEVEKIKIFLNDDERNLVDSSYKLINKDNLTEKEYKDFVKKYPLLEKEELYILNTKSKEDIEKMNSFLGKPMLIIWGIENGASLPFANLPEGTDPFMVLKNLPKEQLNAMKSGIDEQFKNLSETMINQSATNYIKSEYEVIGINMKKTQSNYILYTGGIMLLIALLSMAASIGVGFISARVSASLGRNLRDKVFKQVTAFSNSEFDDFSTASLITRSTNDIHHSIIGVWM